MSIKNLDILFNLKRIKVIGASENDKSAGYHLLKTSSAKASRALSTPFIRSCTGFKVLGKSGTSTFYGRKTWSPIVLPDSSPAARD